MKRSLFLIGMPYVGKSHWGKLLAGHYNVPFTDLDDLIEQTAGRTIPDIFSQSGEDTFRAMENQCLNNLLTTETTPQIVACGGGTPCFFQKGAGAKVQDADARNAIVIDDASNRERFDNGDVAASLVVRGDADTGSFPGPRRTPVHHTHHVPPGSGSPGTGGE